MDDDIFERVKSLELKAMVDAQNKTRKAGYWDGLADGFLYSAAILIIIAIFLVSFGGV
ncbi:MAG: hypothetical protein ACYCT2_09015 [Thermoplasmataceae archaeon]